MPARIAREGRTGALLGRDARGIDRSVPRRIRPLLLAPLLLALAACGLLGGDGPVRVAAIGALNRDLDRAPSPLSLPNRLLLDATAGGLVGFSADGQVQAGLAERWTVIDDGRSYIFRIREARWPGGRRVRTDEVARVLRRLIASPRLRSPLRGEFSAVRDIRAMTGSVIELRLTRAQPDLLDLLAQPDMAILRNGQGWGPWRARWNGGSAALTPLPPPGSDAEASGEEVPPAVIFWGSPALHAVAQFDAGAVDAVFGGRFEDWPLLGAAGIDRPRILLDPVDGLFGLAVVDEDGLLGSAEGRAAVAMLIGRAAIAEAIDVPGWQPRVTLRRAMQPAGPGAPDAVPPALPGWLELGTGERRARAVAEVRRWAAADNDGNLPVLRIALPDGPGMRILFARLRTDLGAAGIRTRRVPLAEDADLRLVDDLAPSGDPAWYARRLACGRGLSCPDGLDAVIAAIGGAVDADARAAAIVAAERLLTDHGGFIPLGTPVRWSLTRANLAGVRPNARGRHSLIRLADAPD